MKAHFVHTDTTATSATTAFHYFMFHGYEWKNGTRGSWPPRFLGSGDASSPLELAVNAFRLRDVISPGRNLIVSQPVQRTLSGLAHIQFSPVSFAKIIRYPYHEGDDSFYNRQLAIEYGTCGGVFDDPERVESIMEDPAELYEILPDNPDARSTTGRYFEMTTWQLQDVAPRFEPLATIEVTGAPMWCTAPVRVSLSKSLMRSYPIIWSPAGKVFSEDAFRLIDAYLDRDYFAVATVEI